MTRPLSHSLACGLALSCLGAAALASGCAQGSQSSTADTANLTETVTTTGQGGAVASAGQGGAGPATMTVATSGQGGAGGADCSGDSALCGGICIDIKSNANACGGCGNICPADQVCVNFQCVPPASTSASSSAASSTAASSTAASSTASSSSSTGGGGGICDPHNPAVACGAGHQCAPQPNGTPMCQSPIGAGAQYAACTDNTDCGSTLECVTTSFFTTYCMTWCTSFLDCPGLLDDCVALDPAVYVGATQWGVCWDGLP